MATQHSKKVSSNESILGRWDKAKARGLVLVQLMPLSGTRGGKSFSEALSRLLLTEYYLKQDHMPSPQIVTGKEAWDCHITIQTRFNSSCCWVSNQQCVPYLLLLKL